MALGESYIASLSTSSGTEQVTWQEVYDHPFLLISSAHDSKVLSLPLSTAPTKVLIVPLSSHVDFAPIVRKLSSRLRTLEISNRVDSSSASIGKRYARNDELGTPLGITVDFDTVKDGSVTLRDRDSMKQVRASQDDIVATLVEVLAGREAVKDAFERLPEFNGQSNDE